MRKPAPSTVGQNYNITAIGTTNSKHFKISIETMFPTFLVNYLNKREEI
jgi:hypothetical protein